MRCCCSLGRVLTFITLINQIGSKSAQARMRGRGRGGLGTFVQAECMNFNEVLLSWKSLTAVFQCFFPLLVLHQIKIDSKKRHEMFSLVSFTSMRRLTAKRL